MAKVESKSQLIVQVPGIQGGEPVIRGTRVPVRSIVLSLEYDHPNDVNAVSESYGVSVAAAEAALAYYRAHKQEIDRIIDENERAAYGE